MSGFGPFAGEEEIDFEKEELCGIFLITGDTGSGKTTIFDAISLCALRGGERGMAHKRLLSKRIRRCPDKDVCGADLFAEGKALPHQAQSGVSASLKKGRGMDE